MQQGFVNIQTVFGNGTERTIEGLQQVYNNHEQLLSFVKTVSEGVLTEATISGKQVLLKPNWVKHSYYPQDDICLRTHDSFLIAVLELVLSKKPAAVVIGDAPIQGCKWDEMLGNTFIDKVTSLSSAYNIPVSIKDFRRVVFDAATNKVEVECNPISEYVIFDVGKKSYLEPVTSSKNLFRVSQYNPDNFTQTHRPGIHKYCISKEMFNADVVISLPKIKTHQKSGITGALKNIVGFNGDKDYLPHHRIGGAGADGDSYAGNSRLRYLSELALDNAYRQKGKLLYKCWRRLASLLWKISFPQKNKHQLNGAWFGNDTTWRMVMDLNMVMVFGKKDGTLSDTPQRYLYNFCDGIIGGQGDGPLKPDPLNLGLICFSNDAAVTDTCMAELMGLSVGNIPLLAAAKSFMPRREVSVKLDGKGTSVNNLKQYAVKAALPPGWMDYADNRE